MQMTKKKSITVLSKTIFLSSLLFLIIFVFSVKQVKKKSFVRFLGIQTIPTNP